MATATIRPLAFALSPTMQAQPLSGFLTMTPTGDADAGVCVQHLSDGKILNSTFDGSIPDQAWSLMFYFEDDGVTLPLDATISSVEISFSHVAHADYGGAGESQFLLFDTVVSYFDLGLVMDFSTATVSTGNLVTNPLTSAPWQRSDIFNDGDAGGNGHGAFYILAVIHNNPNFTEILDAIIMTVTYAGGSNPQIRRYDGHTDRVFARLPLI